MPKSSNGFTTAAAKSLQSCPTLCDRIDGSPPGSPIPGILQARTLECFAISFFSAWKWKVKVKSLSHARLFVTPMVCGLPGSSIHGIFQARVLEWGAIAFSARFHSITIGLLKYITHNAQNSYNRNTCKQCALDEMVTNMIMLRWD